MEYWQTTTPFVSEQLPGDVWRDAFPARLPDGSRLALPLRDMGETAVAGLIANQASFAVLDRLSAWLVEVARPLSPEIVVGLPTLGHVFGAAVARGLGHANWVAPGTSRKLWYEERLSVPLASITSPQAGRRLWLDPRLAHRLEGRRVLLVDDVVSTGASVIAALDLLRLVGVRPVAICAAMLQGHRWQAVIPADLPVRGVLATPMFRGVVGGWVPVEGTDPVANCPLLVGA